MCTASLSVSAQPFVERSSHVAPAAVRHVTRRPVPSSLEQLFLWGAKSFTNTQKPVVWTLSRKGPQRWQRCRGERARRRAHARGPSVFEEGSQRSGGFPFTFSLRCGLFVRGGVLQTCWVPVLSQSLGLEGPTRAAASSCCRRDSKPQRGDRSSPSGLTWTGTRASYLLARCVLAIMMASHPDLVTGRST